MADKKKKEEPIIPEFIIELDLITSKPPKELTAYEAGFLRARVSYLRPEQKTAFKDVLSGKIQPITPNVDGTMPGEKGFAGMEKPTDATAEPDEKPSDDMKVVDPEAHKRPVLVQMAEDAGIKVEDKWTKEDIAKVLNSRK